MSMGQQAPILPRRLEELPAPVVAFLVNRCRVSLRLALVGCLRELDKEGLVRFEAVAGGTPVVGLGADESRSGRLLLPFEDVALMRVRARAGSQAQVPLSALLSDDGDDYKHWAKRQVDELGQEARRAGLARKAFPRHLWRAAFLLVGVAICAAIAVRVTDPKAAGSVAGAMTVCSLVVLCVPLFFRRWRLTPEGAVAVDAWQRDGGGAPGVARGLGAVGERTYLGLTALSGAPLPAGHAWSSLGGQWHTVQLGVELQRPRWSGLPGLWTVLSWTVAGSFFAVIAGGLDGFDLNGQLIALAPAALGALVIVTCWLPAFAMRMSQPDNVTFIGEVVKAWHVDGGEYSPDHDWVCVDDGSPVTMKFDVGPARYSQLKVAGLVRVSWSPRRGCLNHIEPAR